LQHERAPPLFNKAGKAIHQRIPWSAIAAYARHHGLDVDELKRIIWACDSEFLNADLQAEPEAIEQEETGDG